MPKLNFAHVCEYAFVSNGVPSAIGIFEGNEIISSLPLKRDIGVLFNFQPTEIKKYSIEIRITSPSGKSVVEPKKTEVGPPRDTDNNLGYIVNFRGSLIEEYGVYKVTILTDGEALITLQFRVGQK